MPKPEPEIVQKFQKVKISIPRNKKADPTFLKIGILLSSGRDELSAQEVESKAVLLFKWFSALIDPQVLKRFGELLSEHIHFSEHLI